MHYYIIVLLVVFFKPCTNQAPPKAGTYKIELISVQECDDVGTHLIRHNLRLTKYTRNITCIDGYLDLGIPFNDDVHVLMEAATKGSSGGWNSNHYRFKLKKGCGELRKWYPDWFWMVETPNSTHPRPCPVPKGNYTVSCMDLSDPQMSSIRTLLYATYRFTIHYFVQSKTKVGCLSYVANVVPREDPFKYVPVLRPTYFTA